MKKVSLYIPCYNAEKYIKQCLDGVMNQIYPIDEILIIDDGSNDRTMQIASQYPVKIIPHRKNKGLAAARNTAFKEARNELVASLDADCVAHPDWLKILMKGFKDIDVAGVGGRLIEKYTFGIANKWRSVHMSQHWGDKPLENPIFLYGSNSIYRASIVRSIGLFYEKYLSNYEDVEVSKRIIKNGYRLIYIPAATAYHLRKDTTISVLARFWNWAFFELPIPDNKYNFFKKILNNFKMAGSLIIRDIFKGRLILLGIDSMMAFYHSFLDYKYYKNNRD